MSLASQIHPFWDRPPHGVTEGYSLEITAKELESLRGARDLIAPETPVAVTFLPNEALDARIAASIGVRALGFEPMPHISARRIASHDELETYVSRAVAEAGVKRVFLIAGDPPVPAGPFSDSMTILRTGVLERNGIRAVGIAGHPEGHSAMTRDECWAALEEKSAEIKARGMAPLIVTQFSFDADAVVEWLKELRERGLDAPVRIGVPGPTSIKRLLRFASMCGVGASATVLSKYGISLTQLLGSAGPKRIVDALSAYVDGRLGPVRLHFYPFGGVSDTAKWINDYAA